MSSERRKFVRGRVDVAAFQFVLVRKCDRVDEEVETAPFRLQRVEHVIELRVVLDVARQQDVRSDLCSQRLQPFRLRVALIGERNLGTLSGQHARDAPGDRVVVRHAHHQASPAGHQAFAITHANPCLNSGRPTEFVPHALQKLCASHAA